MVLAWLFIRISLRWRRAREKENEKGANSSNKWIINGYLTEKHTHMQPWWMPGSGPPTKRTLVKVGGKKKSLYQQHAYAWLRPLKVCLIKWVSGWVLRPPSALCCHWHSALCGLTAAGGDRIWYRITRNDGSTLDDTSAASTRCSACDWQFQDLWSPRFCCRRCRAEL